MVDSVRTTLVQLAAIQNASLREAQDGTPSVIELGSYYLVRNTQAATTNRLFAAASSASVFASVDGFLAAATSTTRTVSTQDGSQVSIAALELFITPESPAEARLKHLLDSNPTPRFTPLPAAPIPKISVNSGLSVNEGGTSAITTDNISATAGDATDSKISYQVSDGPLNGHLELASAPGAAIISFTQLQLAEGMVRYVHNGTDTTGDQFTFSVTSNGATLGSQKFSIDVTAADDAPILRANTGATVIEGGSTSITTAQLNATDVDTYSISVKYAVTSGPAHGRLELTTDPGTAITSFTQADLQAGRVRYVNDGSESATDAFTFTLQDKTNTLSPVTFNIAVSPVDDAPVLTNAGATLAAGATATFDTSQLGATDADTADANLVFTVTSGPANGYLQLASDPGVAITSFTQADIVAGDVQYVNDGTAGNDSFDFSLTDGTTTVNDTFNLTVNAVDQPPSVTTNTGIAVITGSTTAITTSQLSAADADTADANLTYTVTAGPSSGQLELSTNPGAAITSFTQADLAAGIVQYVHDGSNSTVDSFTFTLSDQTTVLPADTFDISISATAAPVITANSGATVNEGDVVTLSTANLSASDADTPAAGLTYTVTSAPANGYLQLSTNTGVSITSFTQADLESGIVQYVHNGSETTSDSFGFSLSDGTTTLSGNTFAITVNPVDDAPVLSANSPISVTQGSSTVITTANLNATDPDTQNFNLTYTLTSGPVNGHLEYVTSPGTAITSFTQADVEAGLVAYFHDGSNTASDSFTFTLADQTTTLAAATFNVTVNSLDQPPVLDTNTGATVAEGGATLIDTSKLNASDSDTQNFNLTYTITAGPANGQLEYVTSPGTAITSFTQADIEAGLVQYIHNGSETTSDSFTFTLADQTTTLAPATFSITISPVDDAPALAANNGVTVTEGSAAGLTTSDLSASDVDTANYNLVYTVTSGPANGQLEYVTSPGTTITSFTQADLEAGLVQYVHNGSETTSDAFTFTLSDQTTTLAPATFNISVTPVDDAPIVTANTGTTVSLLAGSTIITTAQLNASDADTANAGVTFNITGGLTGGYVDLTTNPGVAVGSFTEADLAAGYVEYVRTNFSLTGDNFDFTVSDATTTLPSDTFTINVTI